MYNSIPGAYGALPFLGQLWALPWWGVFLFVVFIDYGVIRLLMAYEERNFPPHNKREMFFSFKANDTIVIPVFLAGCAQTMHHNSNPEGWYTSMEWHVIALILCFAMSIALEIGAVTGLMFTVRQELSPSKLYHTFIFGIMGYWMLTGLVAVVANERHFINLALSFGLVFIWAWVVFWADPKLLKEQGRMTPINAHPEWDWRTMLPTWLDD